MLPSPYAKTILSLSLKGKNPHYSVKQAVVVSMVLPKENVLFVGTSLSSQHLIKAQVDKECKCNVTVLKCYTITRKDGEYRPELNIEDLLPIKLKQKHFDLCIIETGVNEISNMKYDRFTKKNIYLKMKKLFDIVISLDQNIKFIILNRTPRSDCSLKMKVTRMSNKAINRIMKSRQPKNIQIDNLNIEKGKSVLGKLGEIDSVSGKRADGIHLRGPKGSKVFITF